MLENVYRDVLVTEYRTKNLAVTINDWLYLKFMPNSEWMIRYYPKQYAQVILQIVPAMLARHSLAD